MTRVDDGPAGRRTADPADPAAAPQSRDDAALTLARTEPPAAPAPAPRGLRHALRAFRHRDYAIFWCGALVSNTGSWLSNLTVPYVLYQLTGSAFWVGLATAAQFAPSLLLGPLGGALADRHDRRRVLLVTQSCMALAALLLWGAWAGGLRDPVLVLALVAVAGSLAGVNMPSWQSFVNDLVPREDLVSAITLNSLQFNAARSLGPGIAGVLLAAFGPAWAFLLNGLSFLFVLGALALVRPIRPRGPRPPREKVLRSFGAAVRYTRGQPGILVGFVVVVVVALLGNPVFQFTVVFAEDELHVGPVGLGLLNVAFGVGAVLAAPLVSGGRSRTSAGTVRWGLLAYGVAVTGFGLAPTFPVALAALVVVGGAFLAIISAVNTSVQMIVADAVRGRVLALRIMVFTGATPLGALLQGWVADVAGPRPTVVAAGVLLVVAFAVLARLRGRLRLARLDDPRDEGPVAA
ncbi:MFS transporter [Geodermatophilus sp. CPCC 205761]|uniref:MFS transporter n=1 Tax=Geodermatophilus sp. CPCC 205761 TaxID=2936597 RepID=UPI003EEBC94E